MPGGVLASEIGSGKTISIIGLLSIGYPHKDPKYQKEMMDLIKKYK